VIFYRALWNIFIISDVIQEEFDERGEGDEGHEMMFQWFKTYK